MSEYLTDKEFERFKRIWKEFEKQAVTGDGKKKTKSSIIIDLLKRVVNLEKLVFFIVLSLSGEGYCTPEMKETMERIGWIELYNMEK